MKHLRKARQQESWWKPLLFLGVLALLAATIRMNAAIQNWLSQQLKTLDDTAFTQPQVLTTAISNVTDSLLSSSPFSNTILQDGNSNTDTDTVASSSIPRFPVIPKPDPFPRLAETLLAMQNKTTRLAGQFMLDVAIIGFAKCGTSTMMYWLGQHPEIKIPPHEITFLLSREPWDLVREMAKYGGDDPMLLRGYKSPNDIGDPRPLRLIREYFPETKLVVGIRHPILMMESFYNHRVQNGFDIKPFEKLEYGNTRGQFAVSWSRAEYHGNLVRLGKTNVSDPGERALLPKQQLAAFTGKTLKRMPNKVYLYETTQLGDKNESRLQQLQTDLENYLGLTQTLPPPIHFSPGKKISSELQAQRNQKKINVCDDQYVDVRAKLMNTGERASKWILEYLLQSPDVYISNRDHFISLVKTYGKDPCPARNVARRGNHTTKM